VTSPIEHNGAIEQLAARPRILMLLENDSYPDDTRVVLESHSLRDAGCEVTVICPTGVSRRAYENVEGVRVYRYPKPWEARGFFSYVLEYGYSLTMAFILSLWVLIIHGFDVVHAHAPPDMFVFIAVFYKYLGKRYVLDQHDLSPELYQAQRNGSGSHFIHSALLSFERMACRHANRLISTNETQRRIQIERGGAAPEHCRVVRNGPAARFLEPVEPLDALKSDGLTIIGYVGMIGVQDGIDYLLRAIACLKHDLKRHDFRAVIVGSGPALRDLKQLARKLDIEANVLFAGYLMGNDLLRHIAAFDLCVTPDPSNPYNDGCTTVKSMEYMAMAKPVVAFDLPENRVSLADAALYANGNDVRELARLIARLIDNPGERARLGQRGRQRVIEHLTWEKQQGNLIQLYRTMLGGDEALQPGANGRATETTVAPVRVTASGRVGTPNMNDLEHTVEKVG
jgi:glycosyltransferase involved in cell wall biosynthesis